MTVAETGQIMDVLRVAYPGFYAKQGADFLRQAIALWASLFVEEPFEVVSAAIKSHISTDPSGFPPSPGAIKQMVQRLTQPPEQSPLEAWALVNRAIQRATYYSGEAFAALPRDIQAVVGGPEQLRQWAAMNEEAVQSVVSSNFQKSYAARQRQRREYAALPADIRAQLPGMADPLRLE